MATKEEIREYFAKFGKKGGDARAKNMTAEERSAAARKAVEARWAKTEKLVAEITAGTKALLAKSRKAAARARRAKAKKKA
jgi:hypothetical protein